MITWIDDFVAIASSNDIIRSVLEENGINVIINVCQYPDNNIENFEYIHVSLIDGPGNDPMLFWNIVDTLQRYVSNKKKIVVHCLGGFSRSVSVVAGWLKKYKGIQTEEAYEFIRVKRPTIIPNSALIDLVNDL